MVTKKDSIKRKRVEDAPASTAAKDTPTPAPTPAPAVDKKKKVETPTVQEATKPAVADKKTEKRKREDDTTSAAPATAATATPATTATATTTKNTKKENNNTNNKKADSTKQENGDSVVNEQPKKLNTIEPNHNVHLARRLNVVKCRVDLYKIPPQCIKFEPTETHFYVDTLKFTKKYLLNIPYPEGVRVDHTNVEATFDSGVLTCHIPIKSDPNKPKDHDKVIAAREQIKEMKQKGIPIPNDLIAAAKLAKTKADKNESEDAPATDAAAPKQKTAKKPLSNKERRQKEKANRPLNEDGTEAPRPKKAKKEPKKKKEFLANPADALQVADQVNDQQEKAIQAKYDKEYAQLSYETRKKIENKEKKLKLREARKQELEKAIEKMPKKEKVTKKSASKVSFAGDE